MIAIRLPTARYLATGGVCTGVHYSLMYVLIRQGVGTTVSSGIGAGMALMLSYVLNNRWVFPNQIGARTSLPKFMMVALAALLLNTAQLALGIALGGVLHLARAPTAGDALWGLVTAVLLVPLGLSTLRSLLRRDVGVDAVALFSMAGSLALGEYLVGAIVGLMMSGGAALEAYAGSRARRELTALIERAPRVAHRRVGDELEEIPVETIVPGDSVVVRPGEVVPVDGVVSSAEAVVDESALTGEPLPVVVLQGGRARSGTANAGDAFELRATSSAADSAYAALVALVRDAETQRAPLVRLADRYAAIFLPVTMAVAGAAWAASGQSLRALAVFVVATES